MATSCTTEKIVFSVWPRTQTDIGIHEKCIGCPRILWDQICSTYPQPKIWWDHKGGCPFHPSRAKEQVKDELQLNPVKASRRGVRGK
jgi:hypothetical protein